MLYKLEFHNQHLPTPQRAQQPASPESFPNFSQSPPHIDYSLELIYRIMSVDSFKQLFSSFTANLDKDLADFPLLSDLRRKTGVRPSHIFVGTCVLVIVLAIFQILPNLLTTLFGMIYPAYMSFKAIEHGKEEEKKVWLTYWIVFGLLTTVDDCFGFFLQYLPAFYALRFLVYLWMFFPRANNGATIIYKLVRPYLASCQATLDQLWKQLSEKKE